MARQVLTDTQDPSYDPTQDPGSPYYQGGSQGVMTQPSAGNPNKPTLPPGTFKNDIPAFTSPGGIANIQPNSQADQSGLTDQQRLSQILASYPGNPQGAIDAFNAHYPNSSLKPALAHDNTIGLADGTYLVAPGTGGNSGTSWQVVQRGNENTGGGGGQTSGAGQTPTPFNFPTFTPPTYSPSTSFQAPSPFVAPPAYQPGTFKAPTLEEAQNQPGYSFGLQQGEAALQNSAAARGTLRTGGTLKDLFNYANNAATQNYGNVYGQDLSTFNTNEANRAQAYNTNYGVSAGAYGINAAQNQQTYQNQNQQGLDTFDRNYAGAVAAFNPKFEASKLSFSDMYNRWLASLNATTQIATAGAQ